MLSGQFRRGDTVSKNLFESGKGARNAEGKIEKSPGKREGYGGEGRDAKEIWYMRLKKEVAMPAGKPQADRKN